MPIATGTALLIGAGVQAVTGLIQGIAGGSQRRKAKRNLDNLKMPTYEIPDSINQMVELARRRSTSEMPGLDTMLAEGSARTTAGVQASALAASSQSDLAAATRNLYAEEMRGARQLGIMSAEYRSNMEQQYMGALGQQGQYEDRAFQINKMMPYEQKLREYMGDLGAGNANISAGISNVTGAVTGYLGGRAQLDMMNAWQGGGGGFSPQYQSQSPNPFHMNQISQAGNIPRSIRNLPLSTLQTLPPDR